MSAPINRRHPDWGRYESMILCRTRQPPQTEEHARERQLQKLPCLASDFFPESVEIFGWCPKLKTLLAGTRDRGSPLHLLRGMEDSALKNICTFVGSEYAEHVTLCIPASCVGRLYGGKVARFNLSRSRDAPIGKEHYYNCWAERECVELSAVSRFPPLPDQHPLQGYVSFATCGYVTFPEPRDRFCNMLPFVFGEKNSLPPHLQCYHALIEQCPYGDEIGKVGYLTVHETYVSEGRSQRRGGLHIETPGAFQVGSCSVECAPEHGWGMGIFYGPDKYEGGIYMASSVANTSEVWDALVNKNVNGIVDKHGSCEHLRRVLGPGTKLEANQLIWMTDCTPHEALPQPAGSYRQFFRVVTSRITHWFAKHSTPNPRVPLPDFVEVVHRNKFED